MFKPEFGGIATERKSQIETRVIHHDLIDRVEAALFEQGFAVDLNDSVTSASLTAESIRDAIGEYSCIRATGWAILEDYKRFAATSEKLNPVLELIERAGRSTLEANPEYQILKESLDAARRDAKNEKDRNTRSKALERVKQQEKAIEQLLSSSIHIGTVEPWLIDGIRLFVDTFWKDRVVLRVYPFEEVPDFGILANLKRDAFLDSDIENVLFAYGPRPNLRLSVLGIITSFPSLGEHPIETIRLMQKALATSSDDRSFEEGVRTAIEGVEGLERFVSFSRYPNVTVYPLAVFRRLAASAPRRPLDV